MGDLRLSVPVITDVNRVFPTSSALGELPEEISDEYERGEGERQMELKLWVVGVMPSPSIPNSKVCELWWRGRIVLAWRCDGVERDEAGAGYILSFDVGMEHVWGDVVLVLRDALGRYQISCPSGVGMDPKGSVTVERRGPG